MGRDPTPEERREWVESRYDYLPRKERLYVLWVVDPNPEAKYVA